MAAALSHPTTGNYKLVGDFWLQTTTLWLTAVTSTIKTLTKLNFSKLDIVEGTIKFLLPTILSRSSSRIRRPPIPIKSLRSFRFEPFRLWKCRKTPSLYIAGIFREVCMCILRIFRIKNEGCIAEFGLDRLGFDNTLVKWARSSEASFPWQGSPRRAPGADVSNTTYSTETSNINPIHHKPFLQGWLTHFLSKYKFNFHPSSAKGVRATWRLPDADGSSLSAPDDC